LITAWRVVDSRSLLLPTLFDSPEAAAVLFFRGAHPRCAARWGRQPLESPQLELLWRWWRRVVHVQFSCASPRDMSGLDLLDLDDSSRSAAHRNPDFVSASDQTVRFPAVTVHHNPPTHARLLRLGARLEQACDVEPDVEANRLLIAHGDEFRPGEAAGQGNWTGRAPGGPSWYVRLQPSGRSRAARPTPS
jgi:hypothetical protein